DCRRLAYDPPTATAKEGTHVARAHFENCPDHLRRRNLAWLRAADVRGGLAFVPAEMPAAVRALSGRASPAAIQVRLSQTGLRSVQSGSLRLLPNLLAAVVISPGREVLP